MLDTRLLERWIVFLCFHNLCLSVNFDILVSGESQLSKHALPPGLGTGPTLALTSFLSRVKPPWDLKRPYAPTTVGRVEAPTEIRNSSDDVEPYDVNEHGSGRVNMTDRGSEAETEDWKTQPKPRLGKSRLHSSWKSLSGRLFPEEMRSRILHALRQYKERQTEYEVISGGGGGGKASGSGSTKSDQRGRRKTLSISLALRALAAVLISQQREQNLVLGIHQKLIDIG